MGFSGISGPVHYPGFLLFRALYMLSRGPAPPATRADPGLAASETKPWLRLRRLLTTPKRTADLDRNPFTPRGTGIRARTSLAEATYARIGEGSPFGMTESNFSRKDPPRGVGGPWRNRCAHDLAVVCLEEPADAVPRLAMISLVLALHGQHSLALWARAGCGVRSGGGRLGPCALSVVRGPRTIS